MKRIATARPGNDCFYGEYWSYAVVADNGLTALQLTVYTDIYPPTVPVDHAALCGSLCERCHHGGHGAGRCGDVNAGNRWGTAKCDCPAKPFAARRRGTDLTFHVGFPTEKEMIRTWTPNSRGACDLLPGSWCDTNDSTATGGRDFFAKYGDPAQALQPESFWLALEALASDKAAAIMGKRVDGLYQRCDHCDGVGVIAKEQP